jgi:hypothetical protein
MLPAITSAALFTGEGHALPRTPSGLGMKGESA